MRVGSEASESFAVRMSLRQGWVMSPWFFNMYMNGVVGELYNRVNGMGVSIIMGGVWWGLNQFLFADTAIVLESAEKLQCLVSDFQRVCKRRKLRINVNKRKVMCVERNEEPSPLNIMLNGERMDVVN